MSERRTDAAPTDAGSLPGGEATERLIRNALEEDLGVPALLEGDVTTASTIPAGLSGSAYLLAKSPLVVCGLPVAAAVFRSLEPHAEWRPLVAEGVQFRTSTDTEVLIEACRRWGAAALQRVSGMFAFALWDASRRRLLLARDRAGEKPLYYAQVGRDFVFASELKGIVAWPGFRRTIHQPALIDFLTFGFVADPKSIWEGCSKLPPAHWMEVELDADGPRIVTQPTPYWDQVFAPELDR